MICRRLVRMFWNFTDKARVQRNLCCIFGDSNRYTMNGNLWMNLSFGIMTIQSESTPWYQAVATIVNRYSEKSVHIFTLDIDFTDAFVSSFKVPIVLNSTSAEPPRVVDTYLVLCRKVESATSLLKAVDIHQGTPWIVGFTTTNVQLDKLFEEFFNHGIHNVIAMYPNNSISTYFPFTLGKCYSFEPVMIRGDLDHVELFREDKIDDLWQCPIKVLLFPIPPEVLFPGKGPQMSKNIAELFGIVQRRMNFTPEFSYALNTSAGVDKMLQDRRVVGMAVSGAFQQVAHGSPLTYRCHAWCVPAQFPSGHNMIVLTSTFRWDMWVACLVSFLVAIAATRYLLDSSVTHGSPWMLVFSIIVECPSPVNTKDSKARFLLSALATGFLVINTMFKARLHSLMTTSGVPTKLTSNAEVYSSSLIMYSSINNDWLADSIGSIKVSPDRFRYWEKGNVQSTEEMQKSLRDGTGTLLIKQDYCKMLAKKFGKTRSGFYKVHPLDSCLASTPSSYLGFSPSSPFADRIINVTNHLREYGLSDRLLMTALEPEVPSTIPSPFLFEDVLVIFLMSVSGLFCGGIVFVIEYFFKISIN